jgi:alkyl hydroperoxide reductase subunit AhpC
MSELTDEIKRMYDLLDEEQMRVKIFVNENGFNCTTAPFVLAKQYRDALKRHMQVLQCNMDDESLWMADTAREE